MTRFFRNPFVLPILMVMLVAACATTQVKSVWKDPTYQVRPAKIFVIGMAKNPGVRRLFEDEFVMQLKAHGTEAVSSYTALPDKQLNDEQLIAAKVKELGADTILITRLVSKKTVQVYVPGTAYSPPAYYGTWSGYYGYGYSNMYSPGYYAEDEYAVIESNMYDTGNDKLVWSASSETVMGDSNQELIKTYIETMVNTMTHGKLLTK